MSAPTVEPQAAPDPATTAWVPVGPSPPGAPGQGVPVGGAAGTILTKQSAADYDATWQPPAASGAAAFVSGGCVWTGDSYGSSLAASMTAGAVVVGGASGNVAAVTGRAFTASRDTYVDISSTGAITYTEVVNNAASPVLAAGNIRVAIIVTGASSIANAGSVNQGQSGALLPIAASQQYEVTDSLGNLIGNRNPNPGLIGYRQTVAAQSSGSHVGVNGCSVPAIIPTGRRVRVKGFISVVTCDNSSGVTQIYLWRGAALSGTQIQEWNVNANANSGVAPEIVLSGLSGLTTFSMSYTSTAGNVTLNAASSRPVFLSVEVV